MGDTPEDGEKVRQAKAASDKAEADARSARIAADKAQHELDQLRSDTAQGKRQAEVRKADADADKAVAEARQAAVKPFVPDLSKVERGSLEVAGDTPIYSSVLAHRALSVAVAQLVDDVVPTLVPGEPVLITDDSDLVTSDAAYVQVHNGLTQLVAAADALLDTDPVVDDGEVADIDPDQPQAAAAMAAAALPAIGSAVASMLPPLLSLFAARRSVKSFAVTVDNDAAIALAAGALTKQGRPARIDDFRLVPEGRLFGLDITVRARRSALLDRKLALEQDRVFDDAVRTSEQGRIDHLSKLIDTGPAEKPEIPRWVQQRDEARAARDAAHVRAKRAAVRIGAIDAGVVAIDDFLTAIHAAPAGGGRPAIVAAALREQLRAPGGDLAAITRVLFLEATTGSANQLSADRPLWAKDKFHSIVSVAVSYWVIDTATSDVLTGGVARGSADLRVDVGESFNIRESED